jgi:ATP-dependent DNA ligase
MAATFITANRNGKQPFGHNEMHPTANPIQVRLEEFLDERLGGAFRVYPYSIAATTWPFNDTDWIYEIKHDDFRALAVIEQGQCRFYSRNRHRVT